MVVENIHLNLENTIFERHYNTVYMVIFAVFLFSQISWVSPHENFHFNTQLYTGWPRKNATILIVNFKDIINKTEFVFILLCGKFIFEQNDTMIINSG